MILERHYLKEFAKLFAVVGIGLSAVLSMLDLVKNLDKFMPHDPSFSDLVYYASMTLPLYLLYLMPVAALLCSLYVVGQASRARETVAYMAAGGRMKRLLAPLVAAGAVLSLLGFALGEFVVPACSRNAREIKNALTKKDVAPSLSLDGRLWLRTPRSDLVRADLYVSGMDVFRGVDIFEVREGRLSAIISADEAAYDRAGGDWVLRNARVYDTVTGSIAVRPELVHPFVGRPDKLKEEARKPYELGYIELRSYLRRLEAAGFKNMRLKVELSSKLSSPLVSLFMVVIGVSFASRRNLGGLAATAVGLVVSLVYWLGYSMSLSLGFAGVIPPVLSAWSMPLVFGAVSAKLFRDIPE